jgi:hypothetical protein
MTRTRHRGLTCHRFVPRDRDTPAAKLVTPVQVPVPVPGARPPAAAPRVLWALGALGVPAVPQAATAAPQALKPALAALEALGVGQAPEAIPAVPQLLAAPWLPGIP